MTKWATPLALTRGLLVGLCLCWLSYTSLEGTERDPSQDQTQTQDVVEAIRLAAKQGDTEAQFNLGIRYASGEGVPQDYAEAGRWFRLAAEQGGWPRRRPTSGPCMRPAGASRRITWVLTCGSTLPAHSLPAISATMLSWHGTESRRR